MSDPRLAALSSLVELERLARRAENIRALRYVLVNETQGLVPCRQAIYWDAASGKVTALSGMSQVDGNAPFVRWLERMISELRGGASGSQGPRKGSLPRVVEREKLPSDIQAEWSQWLPRHVLELPLAARDGRLLGNLLLVRATPFAEHELTLLSILSEAYAHALQQFLPVSRKFPSFRELLKERRRVALVSAGVLVLAMLPVRISSLAPAEVAPRDPWVVRSPQDGVVDSMLVPPNSMVEKGQLLARLDPTALENEYAVARRRRMVAEAEYRRSAQQAVYSRQSKGEISIMMARVGRLRAEEEYMADMLERTGITAERAGIAVYSDPDEWKGRPVRTGERLLTITDPGKVKLDIWLPVEDAISLDPGAKVTFFLTVSPLRPLHCELEYASYTPEIRPDGTLVYNLQATFDKSSELPRVGLKGTAKVYGRRVALAYYLLRRPLAVVRQWMGV